MSPSAKTSGWPGSVRSGSTVTRPARSSSAPVSSPSWPARLEAVTPAAQTTVRAGTLGVPLRRRSSRLGVDADHHPAGEHGHAEPLAASARPSPRATAGRSSSTRSRGLDEQDAGRRAGRSRGSRGAGCRAASSAIWPAISTPVGPAPDDHEGEPARRAAGVGLELGRLEGAEEAAAHDERALERLDLGGVLAPVVVAEVGVARAARHDQRVVGERGRRRDLRRPAGAAPRARSRSKSATSAITRGRCAGA